MVGGDLPPILLKKKKKNVLRPAWNVTRRFANPGGFIPTLKVKIPDGQR